MNEKCWFHGEVVIKKVKGEIPKGLRKVEPKDGAYIIADSETTGNHHLLEEIDGVTLYEKDGMFYLYSDKPQTVKCVDQSRHDAIQIEPCEPGEFILFDRQQEYDHFTDEIRNVRD